MCEYDNGGIISHEDPIIQIVLFSYLFVFFLQYRKGNVICWVLINLWANRPLQFNYCYEVCVVCCLFGDFYILTTIYDHTTN